MAKKRTWLEKKVSTPKNYGKKTTPKKINVPKNNGKKTNSNKLKKDSKNDGKKTSKSDNKPKIAPQRIPKNEGKKKTTIEPQRIPKNYGKSEKKKTISIAPQSVPKREVEYQKKKQNERPTYFSSGAMRDGFSPVNYAKSIIGTGEDMLDDFFTGIGKIPESVIDNVANALAGAYSKSGQEDKYKQITDFIQRDLNKEVGFGDRISRFFVPLQTVSKTYDIANKILNGGNYENVSLLGEKSDSIVQSAGTLAGQIGLQESGINWMLTMASTSYNSALEEAYQNGATWEDSQRYATISSVAEVLSERISGGIKLGGRTLDEGVKKVLTGKIKNNVARTFAKYGFDAVGEGAEEVVSQLGQNLGKKLSFEKDKDWEEIFLSEEARQEYIDSFIGGFVLPMVTNAGRLKTSATTGRDYDSNLSNNEINIVNSETQKRVNEAKKKKAVSDDITRRIDEANNLLGNVSEKRRSEIEKAVNKEYDEGKDYTETELSKEELNSIEDEVLKDLNLGKIDIDTIEEYFEPEKVRRINEINRTIDNAENKEALLEERNKLRSEIAESMKERLREDYVLQESYRQKNLANEKFSTKVSKNESEITKKLRESMEASGADNTRDTHNLYSILNKYGNDTGTEVVVVNSEQMREIGFGGQNSEGKNLVVQGMHKVIDGKHKLIINKDSDQALKIIAGHEITHGLEESNTYKDLQEAVFAYAKTKGDYDTVRKELESLYDGVTDDIDGEVTSELVGRYLFEDDAFINQLSTEKPGLIKQILEKVKRLLNMVTAGSKEARELERVKRRFEDAYRDSGKATNNSDTKYSVTLGMTDEERADELRNKVVTIPYSKKNAVLESGDWSQDLKGIYKFIKKNRNAIGLKESYTKADIDVEFYFGNTRISKSLNEMSKYRQNIGEFKDLLSCLDDVIENSVIVERHADKTNNNDSSLKQMNVLLGAYATEKTIYPVRLEIKELKGEKGRLYFAVTIEKSRVADVSSLVSEPHTSTSISLTVPQIMNYVNPKAIDTLKYIPDEFLSEAQLEGKKKGLEADVIKYEGKTQETERKVKKNRNKKQFSYDINPKPKADVNNEKNVNGKIQFSLSSKGTMIDAEGKDVELQASDVGTHGTLMAIRNIGEAELRGIFELGGIPVPSIAITNPSKVDHSRFGSISLLFDKNTIDPANKKNEVYDRDIWSSRFPSIDYEIDDKKASELYARAREVGPVPMFNSVTLAPQNIEDTINRAGGEAKLVEQYKDDIGMKNFYLAETSSPVNMIRTEEVKELPAVDTEKFDFILERMSDEIAQIKNMSGREWNNKYGEHFKDVQREFWKKELPAADEETISALVDNVKPFKQVQLANKIQEYTVNGGREVKETDDFDATKSEINSRTNQSEYEKWLRDLFKGIQKTAGIPNGKDPFTPSGNRRSFGQLHDPYTLENLVKNMTNGRTQGSENAIFGVSAGAISANMATRFNSISDLKTYEDRINADADETVKGLTDELYESINELRQYYNGSSLNVWDSAGGAVFEFSTKKLTENNLKKILSEHNFDAARIPSEELQRIIKSLNNLKDIPTDYFEAKPQRAVGLDEIAAVVLPKNTDPELKKELSDKEISVIEYDPDVQNDRQDKVNQFDNLKFSLSRNQESKKSTKVLNDVAVSDYAAELQSEYDTTYNPYNDIKELYDFMDSMDGKLSAEDLQEAENMASSIADDILLNMKASQTLTEEASEILKDLRSAKIALSDNQKSEVATAYDGYGRYIQSLFGSVRISKNGVPLDEQWQYWADAYPNLFDRGTPDSEQPMRLAEIIEQLRNSFEVTDLPNKTDIELKILSDFYDYPGMRYDKSEATFANAESSVQRKFKGEEVINEPLRTGDVIDEEIALTESMLQDNIEKGNITLARALERKMRDLRRERKRSLPSRKEIHKAYVDEIANEFKANGMDFNKVLEDAKDKSTFSSVDNTPQRFIEKTLGYKEGQIFNKMTMSKLGKNEADGIRWLNSITGSNGLLSTLYDKYQIKPASKESAAAQKYAEGRYVNEYGDYVKYGDEELAREFKDTKTQERIRGLATDPSIREFYDNTFDRINESRVRNGYEPIPKRNNYYLHFMEPRDFLARKGFPFAPSKLRDKNLPTDINGMTADNKPGQPYFASAKQRKGIRTTYDILGGIEKYANAAKDQIYHIDDIQRFRAVRNYIADMFGQAKGLDDLDGLKLEEQKERIREVFNGHLSTFAKFLHEEANIIAGKTPLIDRGLEGVFGREAINFMKALNGQVGSNMVGLNVGSSLTNMVSVVQAISKSSKVDSIRAFSQMCANTIVKTDDLVEKSDFWVRRQGADKFYMNPWQKAQDLAYTFMTITDNFATEFIIRTKYNEFKRKGYDNPLQKADEWAAKLLSDRSLGQMPQLYNSSTLGLITKFQLEVRNQLDSMWYDTVNEANETTNNSLVKTAKITSTVVQLAVFQHLFGKAFEAVAGYNPAFDIVSVIMTALGLGDDDDDKEPMDRIEEAFLELLEDLPYTSTLRGGRIPMASALPITELIKGQNQYGQDKSRLETIKEAVPYWLLPAGYGQVKKTIKGMNMFDKDNPVPGQYNKSGKLQYPVEDTVMNRIQAGIFGANANKNAREYYDGGHKPLTDKQLQEYQDLNIPISDYWKYRKGLSEAGSKNDDKIKYISSLNFPLEKKAIMMNNLYDSKDEANQWYSTKPAVYSVLGDSYANAVRTINTLKADKDENGNSISGSKKEKVINYLNKSGFDYNEKLIILKSEGYKLSDEESLAIIDYLNQREDVTYEQMEDILKAIGYEVDEEGNVWWD